jgi:hypothetical protein
MCTRALQEREGYGGFFADLRAGDKLGAAVPTAFPPKALAPFTFFSGQTGALLTLLNSPAYVRGGIGTRP